MRSRSSSRSRHPEPPAEPADTCHGLSPVRQPHADPSAWPLRAARCHPPPPNTFEQVQRGVEVRYHSIIMGVFTTYQPLGSFCFRLASDLGHGTNQGWRCADSNLCESSPDERSVVPKRPRPDLQPVSTLCRAASPYQPFKHRAAFSKGQSRLCGTIPPLILYEPMVATRTMLQVTDHLGFRPNRCVTAQRRKRLRALIILCESCSSSLPFY